MENYSNKIEIVDATNDHAVDMAVNMRKADVDEVWASAMISPLSALIHSLESDGKSWTALLDGKPIAMFGVGYGSDLGRTGFPWMLGTDEIANHPIHVLRNNRRYLPKMKEGRRVLVNFVDSRNTTAIRWLKWLGFKIEEAKPYGALNKPFHRFSMECE